MQELNQPCLRSSAPPPPEVVGEEEVNEFVAVGSYVAVAAPESSHDTVWIIKVAEVNRIRLQELSTDSYHHEIAAGIIHLSGHFLEKVEKRSSIKSNVFKLSEGITYFFKESIVYPYVNVEERENELTLSMQDYTDILYYIEKTVFSHL